MDGEGGTGGLPGPLQTGVGKPETRQIQGETASSTYIIETHALTKTIRIVFVCDNIYK